MIHIRPERLPFVERDVARLTRATPYRRAVPATCSKPGQFSLNYGTAVQDWHSAAALDGGVYPTHPAAPRAGRCGLTRANSLLRTGGLNSARPRRRATGLRSRSLLASALSCCNGTSIASRAPASTDNRSRRRCPALGVSSLSLDVSRIRKAAG